MLPRVDFFFDNEQKIEPKLHPHQKTLSLVSMSYIFLKYKVRISNKNLPLFALLALPTNDKVTTAAPACCSLPYLLRQQARFNRINIKPWLSSVSSFRRRFDSRRLNKRERRIGGLVGLAMARWSKILIGVQSSVIISNYTDGISCT